MESNPEQKKQIEDKASFLGLHTDVLDYVSITAVPFSDMMPLATFGGRVKPKPTLC